MFPLVQVCCKTYGTNTTSTIKQHYLIIFALHFATTPPAGHPRALQNAQRGATKHNQARNPVVFWIGPLMFSKSFFDSLLPSTKIFAPPALKNPSSSSFFKLPLQIRSPSSFFKFLFQVPSSSCFFKFLHQAPSSSSFFKLLLQVPSSRSFSKILPQVRSSSSFYKFLSQIPFSSSFFKSPIQVLFVKFLLAAMASHRVFKPLNTQRYTNKHINQKGRPECAERLE